MPTDPVITAAAREAVAKLHRRVIGKIMSEVDITDHYEQMCQAFDRHAAAAVAEREALIVAWLRTEIYSETYSDRGDTLGLLADALARGDHLKDQTHG